MFLDEVGAALVGAVALLAEEGDDIPDEFFLGESLMGLCVGIIPAQADVRGEGVAGEAVEGVETERDHGAVVA